VVPVANATPRRHRVAPFVAAAVLLLLTGGGILWGQLQVVLRITEPDGKVTEHRLAPGSRFEVVVPAAPKPKSPTVKILPAEEPVIVPPGAALSAAALVPRPAPLPGVRSWTLATRSHSGPVKAVAYRPDGRRLATACNDGLVR